MSTQQNTEIVRRFFDERWNKQNLAVYDELRAPDPHIARERAWVSKILNAFQPLELMLLDTVAQGDQVAVHFRVVAVFGDDFPGIGNKGESVDYRGMALLRLQDGIIVEDAAYLNDPKILQLFSQLSDS